MNNTNHISAKTKALRKVKFLEEQLESLNHYLPETYEYLMKELDQEKRKLTEAQIREHFAGIDLEHEINHAAI